MENDEELEEAMNALDEYERQQQEENERLMEQEDLERELMHDESLCLTDEEYDMVHQNDEEKEELLSLLNDGWDPRDEWTKDFEDFYGDDYDGNDISEYDRDDS